jgi:hypothetical protein
MSANGSAVRPDRVATNATNDLETIAALLVPLCRTLGRRGEVIQRCRCGRGLVGLWKGSALDASCDAPRIRGWIHVLGSSRRAGRLSRNGAAVDRADRRGTHSNRSSKRAVERSRRARADSHDTGRRISMSHVTGIVGAARARAHTPAARATRETAPCARCDVERDGVRTCLRA